MVCPGLLNEASQEGNQKKKLVATDNGDNSGEKGQL
jgi:hypothetical protein